MEKTGRRFLRVLWCVTLIGYAIVGNLGSATASTKILKLGALYAQSGPVSSWGIAAVRGMQLIADEYNEKGGITVGGQIYKLQVVIYDDKAMGKEGVLGAQSLINEHKVPYIQCFWGDVVKAIRPITTEAKIIVFHTGRTPVLEPKWPYLFHTNTSAIQEADAFYPVVFQNNPSAKTACMLAPDNDAGRAWVPVFANAYKKYGKELLMIRYHDPKATDFYPDLTAILAMKPDMLDYATGPVGSYALILKQAYELGFKGVKICETLSEVEIAEKIAGRKAIEGVWCYGVKWNDPLIQKYQPGQAWVRERYIKKWGKPWITYSTTAAWSLDTYLRGLLLADSLDPDKVASAVQSLNYESRFGRFSFGGLKTFGIKHMIQAYSFVGQVKNGKADGVKAVFAELP
jgi:branched-chain amino acid transport system substrate-binding protein